MQCSVKLYVFIIRRLQAAAATAAAIRISKFNGTKISASIS